MIEDIQVVLRPQDRPFGGNLKECHKRGHTKELRMTNENNVVNKLLYDIEIKNQTKRFT